jgi:hypothetical protein
MYPGLEFGQALPALRRERQDSVAKLDVLQTQVAWRTAAIRQLADSRHRGQAVHFETVFAG